MNAIATIETTDAKLARLRARRAIAEQKLITARESYLNARTRKNALESEINRLSSEIELLEQGQLSLGDFQMGGG